MESITEPSTSSLLANDEFIIHDPSQNNYANGSADPAIAIASATPKRSYPIVEVISPETLMEGYTFDIEINHEILTVEVVSHNT